MNSNTVTIKVKFHYTLAYTIPTRDRQTENITKPTSSSIRQYPDTMTVPYSRSIQTSKLTNCNIAEIRGRVNSCGCMCIVNPTPSVARLPLGACSPFHPLRRVFLGSRLRSYRHWPHLISNIPNTQVQMCKSQNTTLY